MTLDDLTTMLGVIFEPKECLVCKGKGWEKITVTGDKYQIMIDCPTCSGSGHMYSFEQKELAEKIQGAINGSCYD